MDLYDILNLAPSKIEMFEEPIGKNSENTSSKFIHLPIDIEIKLEKWTGFEEEFKQFEEEIHKISKQNNSRIYGKPYGLSKKRTVGSEGNVIQNHVMFLNRVFEEQIYKKMYFNNADNRRQKIKSDVFWSTTNAKEFYMNDFIAEIKTELDLELPPCDNLLKLYQDKDEKITNAICQMYSYTRLFRNQNKDISDRLHDDTLYISERIGIDKQFMGYFFILMLRYPQFTPNGFEDIQSFIKIVHEKFSQRSTQKPNKTSQKVTTRGQAKKLEGQRLKKELYYIWLDDSEVFYSNDNYVLSSFFRDDKKYAMKCCDMENSDEEAIDEIRNESEILEYLDKTTLIIQGKSNCEIFPKILFVGPVCIYWMVVTEFIDGTCYNDFDKMEQSEKKACLYSLKQLHTLKIRHGDVRAPNFIIKKSPHNPDPIAVIIDFGRSQKDASNQSLKEEYDQLYHVLNSNGNDSKGALDFLNDSNSLINLKEWDTNMPINMPT